MVDDDAQATLSPIVTSVVIASRYIPVRIVTQILVLSALVVPPATLSSASLSALLPLTSFLAIVSLGRMPVIMIGASIYPFLVL